MDGGAAADSDGLLAPDSDRAAVLYSDRIEVINLAGEAGNGSDVMMAIGSGVPDSDDDGRLGWGDGNRLSGGTNGCGSGSGGSHR